MSPGKVLVAACVLAVLAGGGLVAQNAQGSKPTKLPVYLEIPGTRPDVVSWQTQGAWPITIRALGHKPLGIGTYSVPYPFPIGPQQAFVLFADPDGCFSLSSWGSNCGGGRDETFLEFTPTTANMAGLLQPEIDGVNPVRLGPAPTLLGWTQPLGNNYTASVGPNVGSNANSAAPCVTSPPDPDGVCDNYGYGASPNMPGLVVVSDTGVGLVWDDESNFTLAAPLTARNLAGLMNSVSWTLNDCEGPGGCATGKTVVTAHMNVPRNLFKPVVRLDLGFTKGGTTVGRMYQIDGQAPLPDDEHGLFTTLNNHVSTVRVFVVSGRGPDVLMDLTGDGEVDVNDAREAGYVVLSNEVVFRFRTFYQSLATGQADLAILYDFNGDGMDPIVTPGGAGGVTGIPR